MLYCLSRVLQKKTLIIIMPVVILLLYAWQSKRNEIEIHENSIQMDSVNTKDTVTRKKKKSRTTISEGKLTANNRTPERKTIDEINKLTIPNDPCEFIKTFTDPNITYDIIQSSIQEEEILLLHQMINDPKYSKHAPIIATLIGLTSDKEESLLLLVDYFKRDDFDELTASMMITKLSIPMYFGKIGGNKAKHILKNAISKQGAGELVEEWYSSVKVKQLWPDLNRLITHLQGYVGYGLIYMQEADTNKLIDQYYKNGLEEYTLTGNTTPNWDNMCACMALKDCINEVGLEEIFRYKQNEKENKMRPYLMKYAPHYRKIQPQIEMAKQVNNKLTKKLKER